MADDKSSPATEITEGHFGSLPVGSFIGRYEILTVIGQGAFGITYRARDAQLGREVAIKEYLPSALAVREGRSAVLPRSTRMADDFTWGRQRFVDEGRTVATLHDAPAIVRVFDFLEANGTAYIVMELLSGETLEHRLRRQGPLSPTEIDAVLVPLLDGLEQVHNTGFLHRDIKPANILLNAAGKPTLIDFGASRMAMAGRTSAMTAVFTPGYAASEQMTSAKQGPWTDVYGMSATIYHAITGKAPPSAFDRMLDDAYVPLGKLLPAGFAPGLLAGIDAGLALRASDRPQSIAGWRPIFAYAGGSAGDATVVMRPSVEPAAARTALPPARRSRTVLYGAIAAAVLALLAGGYLTLAGKPQSTAVQDLKVEQLEQILAERRQADAEAAAKRRLEEEARKKGTEEAAAKVQADSDVERKRIERQKAEQELAQLKAQIEARRKEEADLRRIAADEAARRKAEDEIAALKAAEDQARQKAADEAVAKRLADEALAKAEAERKEADQVAAARAQAEAEAKMKADAETRQRAERDADRKVAEAAEAALRLGQADRQRLQVALTSLGFDTRGSDGTFGPRTREMIAAWQKARSLPSSGFLNVVQQQALLREAVSAVARFDEEQKKADEERKKAEEETRRKAEEETRRKAEEEARARAATAPPAATVAANGTYTGGMTSPERNNSSGIYALLVITVEVSGGRGLGRMESKSSANQVPPHPISFTISPDGSVSGSGTFLRPDSSVTNFGISGRAAGNTITLNFTGLSRPVSVTLTRAANE